MKKADKIKLMLSNINKYIVKNEIKQSDWDSFEVTMAFTILEDLRCDLEYKRGKVGTK